MQETPVDPWVGKIPWRRDRLPTPVFLGFPGGSDDKESACNAGDPGLICGLEDPLEKGMATHSSTLAWRFPRIEQPDRIQSMGLQRVGHDWVTNTEYMIHDWLNRQMWNLGYGGPTVK